MISSNSRKEQAILLLISILKRFFHYKYIYISHFCFDLKCKLDHILTKCSTKVFLHIYFLKLVPMPFETFKCEMNYKWNLNFDNFLFKILNEKEEYLVILTTT